MGTGSAKFYWYPRYRAPWVPDAQNPILSAAELDAMIRVEVERIEPAHSDATVFVALQP